MTAIATGIMSPMHLRGIEPRSFGWKPNILTIELQMLTVGSRIQLRGIEPRTHGWQPSILPLDHSCFKLLHHDQDQPQLGIEPRQMLYESIALPLCYKGKYEQMIKALMLFLSPGIEPGTEELQSPVLPLHHERVESKNMRRANE